MKTCGGVKVYLNALLISVTEDEWLASFHGRFNPDIYWTGFWLSSGFGLDRVEERKSIFPAVGSNPDSSVLSTD
jgi:hypothetical protein